MSEPLNRQADDYVSALTRWWAAYLASFVPAVFDLASRPEAQADQALEAMAVAAGRWARHESTIDRQPCEVVDEMRAISADGRDPIRPVLTAMLVESFCRALQDNSETLPAHLQPMDVPLKLAGLREGGALAFAGVKPRNVTLAVLDQYLQEQLPPLVVPCRWIVSTD